MKLEKKIKQNDLLNHFALLNFLICLKKKLHYF